MATASNASASTTEPFPAETEGGGPDRPLKRSLTLSGHRTSVSLEAAFWEEFRRVAKARGLAINALAAIIDADRDPEISLASAIRVFLLRNLQAEARDARAGPPAQPSVASTGKVSSSQ